MNRAQKKAYNAVVKAWEKAYRGKPGTVDVAEPMREAFLAGLTDAQVNDAMDAAQLRTYGPGTTTTAKMDARENPSKDLRRRPR